MLRDNMFLNFGFTCAVYLLLAANSSSAQLYEDSRCRCVCPSPSAVVNNTVSIERRIFTGNIVPKMCNCKGMVLNKIGKEIMGYEQLFCLRCECKYEIRNTTMIMIVVFMIICVLMLMVVYMSVFVCLYPLTNRGHIRPYRAGYHRTDEAHSLLMVAEELDEY